MGDTPKKYHITDNGDIYKVNDDGSFTSMGNAVDDGVAAPGQSIPCLSTPVSR